ncbi:GDP-L-fucose synthase [Pseudoroseomonas sp. WGS1072]|uniref:GDP-L-fucose synthase n=1 Tax=Roseomonas sp. WGS1072 TaxID=3366816 RepID=UPI003BF2877E
MHFPIAGRRVFVAGHRGMVGSACMRRLSHEGCTVLTADRRDVNLIEQQDVRKFLQDSRPDVVIVAAAKVGGILANDTYPAEFLYENLMIASNIIEASFRARVGKLLFLGSSCVYPGAAPQPIVESALLSGPLEPTNQWYAVAKIAGLKLCEAYRKQYGADFISAMPSNLYGPNDYFHPERSHVLPGLLQRFHRARLDNLSEVVCWGSGRPRREFLHVDDLADACVFLLKNYSQDETINVGTGTDITIAELAELIASVTGYEGKVVWDQSKPDGTMLKRMDVSRLTELGWRPQIPLEEGVAATYQWFLQQAALRR